MVLDGGRQVELAEDRRHVLLDRPLGDDQILGDRVVGAALGHQPEDLALGIAFAAIVSRPLADEGFRFTLPVATLVVLLVLAAVAGVLAAIQPARRAARVDVLRAVTTE